VAFDGHRQLCLLALRGGLRVSCRDLSIALSISPILLEVLVVAARFLFVAKEVKGQAGCWYVARVVMLGALRLYSEVCG
jgi:hypothetical protein